MALCQLLCCFSAAISYVFCIFPCRQSAFMFFSDNIQTKVPKDMRVKLGIVLSVISVLFAIMLPDVAKVVSILGALFSATISMTFPALFALRMHWSCTYLTCKIDYYMCCVLLLFGVLFSIGGTILSIVFAL
uniref:Putative sodium-coupled neutral amino acid transporter 6 n=1 Tax=Lygus hesperus TaxID=30085 RepID=A0A0A9Y3V8_LYGHE